MDDPVITNIVAAMKADAPVISVAEDYFDKGQDRKQH
jgi:hypothetical protein